jgi:spore germination protein GerM
MSRWVPPSILAAILLTGCGVPVDEAPRQVQVPPGPFPTLATANPTAVPGRADETLCFVRDNRLDDVVRRVDAIPDVNVHLRHLLVGPSTAERSSGLSSALPGAIEVAGARLNGTLAEVDVREVGDGTGRSDEILAFGQIVCTLTRRADVYGVRFRRDGQPLDVPRADGSVSRQPLTAADYLQLMWDR